MKAVVVTGVSKGIGYAITKVLIANGITVFGSVRSEQDAEQLSKEFGNLYFPLIFDVTDEEQVKKAAIKVREQLQGKTLWGLVNNAGMVVGGPLIYLPIKDFRQQLDVNLVGQLIVTQAFVPLLGEDKTLTGEPGKIINISSVAGKLPVPFVGAYAVSKHGLEAFSEVLRMELMIFGIDVVVIAPGAIQSKIWKVKDNLEVPEYLSKSVYMGSINRARDTMIKTRIKTALPAEMIGNLTLKILNAKKTKLRFAPVPRKFRAWTLQRMLPKRLRHWLIAKRLELLKK